MQYWSSTGRAKFRQELLKAVRPYYEKLSKIAPRLVITLEWAQSLARPSKNDTPTAVAAGNSSKKPDARTATVADLIDVCERCPQAWALVAVFVHHAFGEFISRNRGVTTDYQKMATVSRAMMTCRRSYRIILISVMRWQYGCGCGKCGASWLTSGWVCKGVVTML